MIYYFDDDSLADFYAENKETQMPRLRNQEEGRQRCEMNVCVARRAYVLRCPNGARTELLVCLSPSHSQNLLGILTFTFNRTYLRGTADARLR